MPKYDIKPLIFADLPLPLMVEHWTEVALDKAVMVLKPSAARYAALEQSGHFFLLGALCDDEIVGYVSCFVSEHLHYSGLVYGTADALFVNQEHRGHFGVALIHAAERECQVRGSITFSISAPVASRLVDLLPKMGFQPQETIFTRVIPRAEG